MPEERVMRLVTNTHPGTCKECGKRVEPGEGLCEFWYGKRLIYHSGCVPDIPEYYDDECGMQPRDWGDL